jgi:hypothetical protein
VKFNAVANGNAEEIATGCTYPTPAIGVRKDTVMKCKTGLFDDTVAIQESSKKKKGSGSE